MTFDDDARIDSGRVRRRGRTGAAIGGGGIGVVLIAFLISQFTGFDVSGLLGGGATGGGSDTALENCETGEQANASTDCRLAGAADSLDTYWSQQASGYASPQVILFDQQVNTGCGGATSAVGPFYCPADRQIYIDTSFYDELSSRFGGEGGPLAEMYVLAHEWGHHLQTLDGTSASIDQTDTGPTSDSVRLELQADCYAGAWVGAASTIADDTGTPFLEPVTDDQVGQALSAASAVGDDRIQEATQGRVDRESWTHGSSESRQKWFSTGMSGGPSACDTFSVATP